jgi:hypothetical protein
MFSRVGGVRPGAGQRRAAPGACSPYAVQELCHLCRGLLVSGWHPACLGLAPGLSRAGARLVSGWRLACLGLAPGLSRAGAWLLARASARGASPPRRRSFSDRGRAGAARPPPRPGARGRAAGLWTPPPGLAPQDPAHAPRAGRSAGAILPCLASPHVTAALPRGGRQPTGRASVRRSCMGGATTLPLRRAHFGVRGARSAPARCAQGGQAQPESEGRR